MLGTAHSHPLGHGLSLGEQAAIRKGETETETETERVLEEAANGQSSPMHSLR